MTIGRQIKVIQQGACTQQEDYPSFQGTCLECMNTWV